VDRGPADRDGYLKVGQAVMAQSSKRPDNRVQAGPDGQPAFYFCPLLQTLVLYKEEKPMRETTATGGEA
jgi:hypothetical protein